MDVSAAPTARSSDDLPAVLTGMDAARQTIALLFGQALAQTTAPDMLARGRRIAINFADAVEQRGRSVALRDDNGSE